MLKHIAAPGISRVASFFQLNLVLLLELLAESCWKELVSALPPAWQGHFGVKRWFIVGSKASGDLEKEQGTKPIAQVVPADEILVRRIELPLASRFYLPNLMRYEASRHVPLPLDQVRLDFRIVSRDVRISRMVVELAVIRLEAVEAAIRESKVLGLEPEAIFLSTRHGPWFARRPLANDWRQIWLNRRWWRLYLKMAIPALLTLACVLAAQGWAARFAADGDAAVLAARSQAAGIEPLRQQFSVSNEKLGFLANIRRRASAAIITEEVARLLPDDAWLEELDIEDQDVRLLGTARHATDLLRVFSGSSLFNNGQFEAPLTQASDSAGDQFDIVMARD